MSQARTLTAALRAKLGIRLRNWALAHVISSHLMSHAGHAITTQRSAIKDQLPDSERLGQRPTIMNVKYLDVSSEKARNKWQTETSKKDQKTKGDV